MWGELPVFSEMNANPKNILSFIFDPEMSFFFFCFQLDVFILLITTTKTKKISG